MAGSYIPFAKTHADRDESHDPRLSARRRYGNRQVINTDVEEAAKKWCRALFAAEYGAHRRAGGQRGIGPWPRQA